MNKYYISGWFDALAKKKKHNLPTHKISQMSAKRNFSRAKFEGQYSDINKSIVLSLRSYRLQIGTMKITHRSYVFNKFPKGYHAQDTYILIAKGTAVLYPFCFYF